MVPTPCGVRKQRVCNRQTPELSQGALRGRLPWQPMGSPATLHSSLGRLRTAQFWVQILDVTQKALSTVGRGRGQGTPTMLVWPSTLIPAPGLHSQDTSVKVVWTTKAMSTEQHSQRIIGLFERREGEREMEACYY